MLTASALDQTAGIRHAFFTRNGGVSDGLYGSLNCGFGSGDDSDRVRENRDRAMRRLGFSGNDLNTVYQIHSATAAVTREPWRLESRPKADAMVTDRPGMAIGILTADCVPVLFADADAGVIGAAHAGWRGAKDGVLEATISAMVDLGAKPDHITTAIGPCIHQASYEVGPEFHAGFVADDPANGGFFAASSRDGHFMFDLPGYAADRLTSLGLKEVDTVAADTCGDEDRFFSYRRATKRGESDFGRGLSAIALEGN